MSSEDGQSRTEITADLRVGRIAGGTAAAVMINSAGSVAISAAPLAHPPDNQTVRAFLEWASEPAQPPRNAGEELRRLWATRFLGHGSGDTASQDLLEVVRGTFSRIPAGGFHRLILLASPGMGKTPALRYCLCVGTAAASLRTLDAESREDGEAAGSEVVIPLYVSLARLQSEYMLESLVRDAFNSPVATTGAGGERITTDQAIGLLQNYRCLLLLDDLEELLSERHRGALQTLSQFMDQYPQHQYVISCRTSSYRQQLGNLEIVYLDDLQGQEAQAILGPEIYGRLSRSSQELVRNRGMVEDFLSLDKSAEALQSKGRLLQFVVRKKRQDNDGIYRDYSVDPRVVEGLLERLSISMRFDRVRSYSERQLMAVVAGYLEEWREPLSWRTICEALQRTEELDFDEQTEQWSFRDRNHEAFFSASALVHDSALMDRVLAQLNDYWWRDVVEVLVGLVPEPQPFFFELIDRNVLVAANSVQFAGEAVSRAVADALIDALVEQLPRENSARRQYIVERIGESDHPRATDALLRILHRDWSSRVVMAAVHGLRTRLQKDRQAVQETEIQVLFALEGWEEPVIGVLTSMEQKPSRATVRRLMELVQDPGQHPRLRGVAAIELGLCATPGGWNALLDLIEVENQDEFVAWCAVEALTQCRQQRACRRVGRLLTLQQYRGDRWARHRARAVYLLGWLGRMAEIDEQVQRALQDESPLVRGYAVDTLARRDMIGAREQIEALLDTKTEQFVLRKAAEALGQIGSLDSLALLERHLRQKESTIRWSVRQAIAEIKARHQI